MPYSLVDVLFLALVAFLTGLICFYFCTFFFPPPLLVDAHPLPPSPAVLPPSPDVLSCSPLILPPALEVFPSSPVVLSYLHDVPTTVPGVLSLDTVPLRTFKRRPKSVDYHSVAVNFPSLPAYDTLPYHQCTGNVVLVDDLVTADDEIRKFLGHGTTKFGFDLEQGNIPAERSSGRKVSLIQLAKVDAVLLVHLAKMDYKMPRELAKVIEDDRVVKAGVNIQSDAYNIYHQFGVGMRNCVELSLLARVVDDKHWPTSLNIKFYSDISLGKLVYAYLHERLSKDQQTSNWDLLELHPEQITYATADAHVGIMIYLHLSGFRHYHRADTNWFSFNYRFLKENKGCRRSMISGAVWSPPAENPWPQSHLDEA